MAIIQRENIKDLANLDLSPITFTIPQIKKTCDQLDYYKQELEHLKQVKQHNIKLALKYKKIKQKYTQEKHEHNNTKKNLKRYYQAERELNINIHCPFLDKTIKLVKCNESIQFRLCNKNPKQCPNRINTIKEHFLIP
jgi:hypothetical protein